MAQSDSVCKTNEVETETKAIQTRAMSVEEVSFEISAQKSGKGEKEAVVRTKRHLDHEEEEKAKLSKKESNTPEAKETAMTQSVLILMVPKCMWNDLPLRATVSDGRLLAGTQLQTLSSWCWKAGQGKRMSFLRTMINRPTLSDTVQRTVLDNLKQQAWVSTQLQCIGEVAIVAVHSICSVAIEVSMHAVEDVLVSHFTQ